MEQTKKFRLPLFVYILFGVALLSAFVLAAAILSPGFADLYNSTVGAAVRAILSYITFLLPLSLAEILIICIPIIIGLIAYLAYKKYARTWRDALVFTISIFSILSLFFSTFVLGFGCGYHGSTLDEKMGIEKNAVAPKELEDTAMWLAAEVSRAAREIEYGGDDFSVMPYSIGEMNKKLMAAYDKASEKYDFIQKLYSRVKPVMLSEAMSYTHITGVYTYFTGEANINVNFPDYTIPYTAAHELAHQRGIAREDEANFVAFLVCMESDDPYIRYSAYLNVYEYVASALSAQKEAYARVYATLDSRVPAEMRAYSKFFDKYRHSTAGKVSEKVNNTYLQVQGTVGTKSYGMVVDLTVAYYLEEVK